MSGRNVVDPFNSLPNEVLGKLASYLRFEDLKAFTVASWSVMNATSGNLFWKGVLYREAGPTGPVGVQLDRVLIGPWMENVDYKQLWLWLEKVTRPVFGVGAPWLGAANRRRIWGACEEVAGVYWERRPRPKNL